MTVAPVLTPTSRIRLGLAVGDITPPQDIYHRLWGAASHDQATGVHRPLRASILTFEPRIATTSAERHHLIALDLCLFRPPEMEEIHSATAAASGLPRETITFTFSHTHSSGNYSRERAAFAGGNRIGPYLDSLPAKLASLIAEATQSISPATLTYGTTVCSMGHNRDFADSARGHFVCGFNPEASPGIPLTAIRVSDESGKPRATIVNYACHPTTLAWQNSLISPDYIGALRETVELQTGRDCLFLLAPCGDVGPRRGYVGDAEQADRNGRQLAYSALSAVESLPAPETDSHYAGPVFSGATLGAWEDRPHDADRIEETSRFHHLRLEVALPYLSGQPTVEQLERSLATTQEAEEAARTAGHEDEASRLRALGERHRRHLERVRPLPAGTNYPYEVHLWRMGDAIWLTLEGEPYHALQEELSRRFPKTPFVYSVLANGARPSYLPERSDYGKPLYQAEIAVLAPGSLETLTDAISRGVRSLLASKRPAKE